jgi:hypothetical protein
MEVWKPVVGFENHYAVSNFGRIKRTAKGKGTFPGRIVKKSKHSAGYHALNLSDGTKKNYMLVHRIVCEAFYGPAPTERHEVAHKDGCKTNNRLANLRWATPAENTYDNFINGVSNGSSSPDRRILSDDDVIAIRKDPRTSGQVAVDYGTTDRNITAIRRRDTYKHIPRSEGDYVQTKERRNFTDDQVRSIRFDERDGPTLAKVYGVTKATIYGIKNRRYYAYVD